MTAPTSSSSSVLVQKKLWEAPFFADVGANTAWGKIQVHASTIPEQLLLRLFPSVSAPIPTKTVLIEIVNSEGNSKCYYYGVYNMEKHAIDYYSFFHLLDTIDSATRNTFPNACFKTRCNDNFEEII